MVDWMNGCLLIHNLELKDLATNLKEVISVFESFSINHVFQELNQQADALCKEGLSLPTEEVHLVEFQEGETHELHQFLWT